MAFFACLMAIGEFPNISSTILSAFSSASAKLFVTWLTRPNFKAYYPLTLLPVKISSLATEAPIVLAKVWGPPPPGIKLQ